MSSAVGSRRVVPGARRVFFALVLAAAATAGPRAADAATLVLAPGQRLAAVLQAAADGDTVEIPAGEYRGEVGVIEGKRLRLRGVGGPVVLHAAGRDAEGKAILVVRDGDVSVEDIEFRGARVRSGNGAGIRFERGRLTVLRCDFHDNENGMLVGNDAASELIVRDSRFSEAPRGTELPHLLYVGTIARFTLSGSRFEGGAQGHLVKSRAAWNDIRSNWLVDGAGGQAAYELEFPYGGMVYVVGNVIGQSAGTSNPAMLSFGAEGPAPQPRQHGIYVANNTFVNEAAAPAWPLRVHADKLGGPVAQRLRNNLWAGALVPDVAWHDPAQGNHAVDLALLAPAADGYALPPRSDLHGRGVLPGRVNGIALGARGRPMLPVGERPLPVPTRWTPGARIE